MNEYKGFQVTGESRDTSKEDVFRRNNTTRPTLNELRMLSRTDLIAIIEDAKFVLSQSEERERKAAAEEISKLLKERGFTTKEIQKELLKIGNRARQAFRDNNITRYLDPKNPENTWTGRGRLPIWLKNLKDAGEDIEKFRVAP